MFKYDWLKKIQKKYGATSDVHMSNYEHLLNFLRSTDDDTPRNLTAGLLKRLLTGTSANEINRIISTASNYNRLLDMFMIYDEKAAALKEKANHPSTTPEEKETLKSKWEEAWARRDAYWTAMQLINIPLTQICYDIDNSKYMWTVDADRIV